MKLSLDSQVNYQIKVPGDIREFLSGYDERITLSIEKDNDNPPITILKCVVDQAGLQGLLRWLYSMGLPLISVVYYDGLR
jgi:hypothetical protein